MNTKGSSTVLIRCTMGMMKNQMPLIAMVFTQFIYTAMFLLSKAAISSGTKPSVFVAYRQAVATIALAPFAYFSHRKTPPQLTFCLLFKIFLVSSCGMALSLNLYYASLNYVSATFSTVANNTIPAMVFILALCLRIETLSITQKQGLVKVIGTVLCLSGAMIFTFYKGPDLYSGSENDSSNSFAKTYTKQEWIKGSLLTLAAYFVWAVWLIMQTPILKEYPASLRLTTLQCWFSCVTSAIYAGAVERHASSWKLGWNVNLLTVIYCGILVTGVTNWLQVWVVGTSGPIFTAIFSPLSLILTAIFSAIFFHESLHWGSVLGGVLLIGGLYAFLWGKNKEDALNEMKASTAEVRLESVVAAQPSDDDHQHRENLKI